VRPANGKLMARNPVS